MTEQNKGTWGTIKFDGPMATKGFALNKMCYSFNGSGGRDEFRKDEAAYCDKFGLTPEQKEAVIARDIMELERLGGSIYYLSSLQACWDLTYRMWVVFRPGAQLKNLKHTWRARERKTQ